jgi:hypothetical protein
MYFTPDYSISYARYIPYNLSVAGMRKRIPLTSLQEYYDLEQTDSIQKSIIGTPPEPVQASLGEINQHLVRRLNEQKASDKFLFIRPGERNIAMKQITDVMFHAVDELWLIDSYFTDKSHGLSQMTDWLRLLTNAQAAKKYLVFYCKSEDNALNAAQLKSSMQRDPIMQDAMLSRPLHSTQLLQTATPIHDRFLIVRSGDTYSGLSIGTSFNSLNSNHYCIYRLAHREAKEVLDVLCAWLHDNISAQEECTYENR